MDMPCHGCHLLGEGVGVPLLFNRVPLAITYPQNDYSGSVDRWRGSHRAIRSRAAGNLSRFLLQPERTTVY